MLAEMVGTTKYVIYVGVHKYMQGDTQAIYFIACTHNTPNTKKDIHGRRAHQRKHSTNR